MSNKVEDYKEWEFVVYDKEVTFYYADPDSIT